MILFSDPRCLDYHAPGHPERPQRVAATRRWLAESHPDWTWGGVASAAESVLLRAHSAEHLARLQEARHFDADTAYHAGIYDIGRLATGAALAAMDAALTGDKAFSLMRPPGHHAEPEQAMGFCYLNHMAICALEARSRGIERVAVWDFDAHHGNGTEAILAGKDGTLYVSVHQHPCYPGTGSTTRGNCLNYPVAPYTAPAAHMATLEESWQAILDFAPQLVLVSAGFDAYEHDPITQMALREQDFKTLGTWLGAAPYPVAAVLEGGYSDDLPRLTEAFLNAWDA